PRSARARARLLRARREPAPRLDPRADRGARGRRSLASARAGPSARAARARASRRARAGARLRRPGGFVAMARRLGCGLTAVADDPRREALGCIAGLRDAVGGAPLDRAPLPIIGVDNWGQSPFPEEIGLGGNWGQSPFSEEEIGLRAFILAAPFPR